MDVQQKIVTAALAIVLIFVVNSAMATGYSNNEKDNIHQGGGSDWDMAPGNPGYTEDPYNDDSGDIHMQPPQEFPVADGVIGWDPGYEAGMNQEY